MWSTVYNFDYSNGMKLNKKEIKSIANKFQWSAKEAEAATKEFLDTPSITNSEEILKICVKHDNSEDRKNNLFKNLYDTTYDSLLELVCKQILNPDPCFDVVVAFNAAELGHASELYELCGERSFLFRLGYGRLPKPPFIELYETDYFDPMSDVYSLCYDFLDIIVNMKSKYEGFDVESFLLEVVSRVGFMAFEIDVFKTKVGYFRASRSCVQKQSNQRHIPSIEETSSLACL